jgi:serine-protein kinase ATM
MTDNESTLRSVTRNLKSTKAKERQEGLTSIQEVFSQDRVVDNLSNTDGPKAWLSVFRALYRCVAEEKEAAVKKSTSKSSSVSATAFRKLEHAAGVVRWLTERTVHLLNKEVIKELLMHLTQTMVYRGALFTPVALDYVHAMTCLASYRPHLEHLVDDTWVKIVEMGFNVILDDPIQARFAEEEATENDIDSDMYMDETLDVPDDDELPATVATGSKKRPRRDHSAPPSTNLPKQDKFKSGKKVLAPSREQLVFAPLVSSLISSPAAPILSPDFPNLSSGILLRLERFLKRFPTDSSLVHSFLAILLSTLKHLSLNRRNEVQSYARSSWDGLLSLWGQKDKTMKESLTAVLRVLFPFLIAPSNMERAPSFDCADAVGRLWQLLDGEADSRWGTDRLTLDALRFELLDPANPGSHVSADRAFVAQTFRAGWDFDAGQALSWAILELKADCAGKVWLYLSSVCGIYRLCVSSSINYPNLFTPLLPLEVLGHMQNERSLKTLFQLYCIQFIHKPLLM